MKEERKPDLKVRASKISQVSCKGTFLSPAGAEKKLTLRDYLSLNHLIGKAKDPELTSTGRSPTSTQVRASKMTELPVSSGR